MRSLDKLALSERETINHIAVLITFCGILFFLNLGNRDLVSSHEARAAQNGQMIVSDGHWGLPHLFDGHLELQKPPLYYWLVALLGHAFGGQVDAWAVRLPAALSGLGCVLFVYYLGRKRQRSDAGFFAALILASCLHFTWLARIGRIDMPLTFAVTLACGGFYLGMTQPRERRWYLLGYISVALGILLKGPIALLFSGGIIGTVAFLRRRLERTSTGVAASLWWGLPLVVLIAAPWFIWANWQTNNQIWEVFFWYHNLERGLGGSETLASHPLWFYLPRILIDLLPWSLALPVAAWYFFMRVGWRRDPEAQLGVIWFLVIFGFLSCMSFKRADYLLPAYPGAALFLGCLAERMPLSGAVKRAGVSLLTCYALGWGIYNLWVVPAQESWPYSKLAHDIRAQTDKPVIFFRAESHVLAFHVGQPLDTILEWENLDIWVSRDFPVYFVMPPDCARDWPLHLTKGRLEEIYRTADHAWGKHERPLVVMRSYH